MTSGRREVRPKRQQRKRGRSGRIELVRTCAEDEERKLQRGEKDAERNERVERRESYNGRRNKEDCGRDCTAAEERRRR